MQLGLCCSSLQRSIARNLADRLERNLGCSTLIIEEDSAAVSATWDEASASDAVLLLLDAVSAPGPVNRRDWESLLEHAGAPPVAVVRLAPCQYPKLLERRRFFAAGSALEAERWVECWLMELLPGHEGIHAASAAEPVPDEWWPHLVDQPGIHVAGAGDSTAARAFAHAAGRHFQEVFWIGCEHRPASTILAEIEHWSKGAARQLFILVYTAMPADLLPRGGRHSYLVLEGTPAVVDSGDPAARWIGACQTSGFPGAILDLLIGPGVEWQSLVAVLDRARGLYVPLGRFMTNRKARERHLVVLEETFRNWRLQTSLCRELTGEAAGALRYGFECKSPAARDLCLHLALFLLGEKRNQEAVTWLRILVGEAEGECDLATAQRARHELSWLVDDAGAPIQDVAAVGEQLAFDFQNLGGEVAAAGKSGVVNPSP